MKKIVLLFFLIIFSTITVYAEDNIFEDTYQEQLEISGAENLINYIEKESRENLKNIGITGSNFNDIAKINPQKIFEEILIIAKKISYTPLSIFSIILAIIIICALFNGLKSSIGDKPMQQTISIVSTLCVCGCIVVPIVKCIENVSNVIKNVANFMIVYVPVITGIMFTSGQALSATNYSFMMVTAGEIISQIAARLLSPLLNMILAVSIVSSISFKMNLSSVCDILNKSVKWVLEFVMATFVTLMTIQTFVATSADNLGTKSVKFAINSFVPVVGGALSEAYTTVYGCLKLLKSGLGAFAILAAGFMFIPIIIECIFWLISLNSCACISDIFELTYISNLLRSSSKVLSTILIILVCTITILLISTGIVLTLGGN